MGNDDRLAMLGRVGVIGAGALGTALARALVAHGANVTSVAARRPQRARALAEVLPGAVASAPAEVADRCDVVLLAVSDDAVPVLASALPWQAGQRVLHLSGARGAEALAPAAARGAVVAALHPLMTFPRADLSTPVDEVLARLRGTTWALEAADTDFERTLEAVVAVLEGEVIRLGPADRVPYHAAAVLASNYVVVLLGAAVRLWDAAGLEGHVALRGLLPLLRGVVEKLAQDGLPDALSGPIARGDVGTVAAHLAWLDALAIGDEEGAAIRDAYRALGQLAIPLGEAKGSLSADDAQRVRLVLESTSLG